MVNFSLTDKIALITGASRGIGESIAMTLSENGAHCILVSRKQEELEVVVKKIKDKGGSAEAMACNMGYHDQILALMNAIEDQTRRLDILINNAAANPYFGEMINAEEWAWDKTLAVNLKAPFFLTQAAAKMMKSQRRWKHRQCVIHQRHPSGPSPGHLFHHQSGLDLHDPGLCQRTGPVQYPGERPVCRD